MKTAILLVSVSMLSSVSFGALREVKPSKACEARLVETALKAEAKHLAQIGEAPAAELKGHASLSYWPAKDGVNVGVRLEEEVEGRMIRYGAKVTKDQVEKCEIQIKRDDKNSCRYSASEGPDSLTNIRGFTYRQGRTIKPKDRVSKLETKQIRVLLQDTDGEAGTLEDLIDSTDDHEVTTASIVMPNGQELTYMGAYGGDNPYGTFFKAGTDEVAGDNGDGFICIK